MAIGLNQILYGATTVIGIIMVALNLVWNNNYYTGAFGDTLNFNWHPFLMVLGMVFLYSQSILVYRTRGHGIPEKNIKIIHGLIHLLAFVASVIGLKAALDYYTEWDLPHMQCFHSRFGWATVIIFAVQFCCGLVSFLLPGSPGLVRKVVSLIYVYCGIMSFIMAIIATVAGISESEIFDGYYYMFRAFPEAGKVLNYMGYFAVLYGCFTVYLLVESKFKKTAIPED